MTTPRMTPEARAERAVNNIYYNYAASVIADEIRQAVAEERERAAVALKPTALCITADCEALAMWCSEHARKRNAALFVPPAWASMERDAYARGATDERERIAKMAEAWWSRGTSYALMIEFAAALRESPTDAQENP